MGDNVGEYSIEDKTAPVKKGIFTRLTDEGLVRGLISFNLALLVLSLFLEWGRKRLSGGGVRFVDASLLSLNLWIGLILLLFFLFSIFAIYKYKSWGNSILLLFSFTVNFFIFYIYRFGVSTHKQNSFLKYIVDFVGLYYNYDGLGVAIFSLAIIVLVFLSYLQFLFIYRRERRNGINSWKKIKVLLIIYAAIILIFVVLFYGTFLLNKVVSNGMTIDSLRCSRDCPVVLHEETGVEMIDYDCISRCSLEKNKQLYPGNYGNLKSYVCLSLVQDPPEYYDCLDQILEEHDG